MTRKRAGIILAAVILFVIAVYAAGTWFFANVLIDLPTSSLESDRAESDPLSSYGLPDPESIEFSNGEVVLRGFFFENPAAADCAVMLLHGYTGTRYDVLPWTPLFWERGCDLLLYDHRGHGESDDTFHTYGFYEKGDAIAALNWLEDRTGLAQSDVGMFGVSYGAATALQAAPLAPGLAFIIADSSYADLDTIARFQASEQFGIIATLLFGGARRTAENIGEFNADAISPRDAAGQTNTPILLTHSLSDEFTPSSNSELIYAQSNPATTVLYLNDWGAPHARDILADYDTYKQQVDAFLADFAPDFGQPN